MGTEDLLRESRSGDPVAKDGVADKVRTAVAHLLARPRWNEICRHEGQEDLAQQLTATVLLLLPKKFDYRGTGSLEAFARQVAELTLQDIEKHRNAKKRRPGQEVVGVQDLLEANHSPNAKTQITPSGEAMRLEDSAQVQEKMSQLPQREQSVLRLRYWEGLTIAEIAGRLGVNENVATKLLVQARLNLKRLLGSNGVA